MPKNITFDKARYDALIRDLIELERSLVHEARRKGLPLDTDFNPVPGTPGWILSDLNTRSKELANAIDKNGDALEVQLETFTAALQNARTVFEETNDLANYSVTKFLADYPELGAGAPR